MGSRKSSDWIRGNSEIDPRKHRNGTKRAFRWNQGSYSDGFEVDFRLDPRKSPHRAKESIQIALRREHSKRNSLIYLIPTLSMHRIHMHLEIMLPCKWLLAHLTGKPLCCRTMQFADMTAQIGSQKLLLAGKNLVTMKTRPGSFGFRTSRQLRRSRNVRCEERDIRLYYIIVIIL